MTRPRDVDVDTGVVLAKTDDLDAVADLHPELVDPASEDPLDVSLRESERVGVARREGAHVQQRAGEAHRLEGRARVEEAVGDAALVEELDGPGVEAPGPVPTSSAVSRRSMTPTVTPASASSPASIKPVGPAPTMVTSPTPLGSLLSLVSLMAPSIMPAARGREALVGLSLVTTRSPVDHPAVTPIRCGHE